MRPFHHQPFAGLASARLAATGLLGAGLLAAALLLPGCSDDDPSDGASNGTPVFQREILGRGAGAMVSPVMITVDPVNGTIYVFDEWGDDILRFDANGQPLPPFNFGTSSGNPVFGSGPRRMRATEGRLYLLSDDGRLVQVTNAAGAIIRTFEVRPTGDEARSDVIDFVPSPDGGLFVLDLGFMQVRRYDIQGVEISRWGRRGTHADEFERPVRIELDAGGNPVLFDEDLRRVQRFSPNGQLLSSWSLPPSDIPSNYLEEAVRMDRGEVVVIDVAARPLVMDRYTVAGQPLGRVTIDYDPRIFYVDEDQHVEFGPDGRLHLLNGAADQVARIGPDGRLTDLVGHRNGARSGEFNGLGGIAATEAGDVAVTTSAGTVNLYRRTGELARATTLHPESPYSPTTLADGGDLAFAPGGEIYVVLRSHYQVVRVRPEGGQLLLASFIDDAYELRFRPEKVAVDRVGRVYLLGPNFGGDGQIRSYSPAGDELAVASLPPRGRGDDYFYYVDVVVLDGDDIGVIRSDGVMLRFDERLAPVGQGTVTGRSGVPVRYIDAVGFERPWGGMALLDRSQDRVVRYHPNGAFLSDLAPPSAAGVGDSFSPVFDLAGGAPGQLYLALSDRIWVYDAE